MGMRSAMRLAVVCALLILPGASIAGGRYDGDWVTHLACEAHGETPAYKFMFPSTIKDGNFHGQHGEEAAAWRVPGDRRIAEVSFQCGQQRAEIAPVERDLFLVRSAQAVIGGVLVSP